MSVSKVKIQSNGFDATIGGRTYSGITEGHRLYTMIQDWIAAGNTPAPEFTQAELDEVAATQYQRDRAAAHIPLQDQLDMMYWDKVNNINTHGDYVAAIKLAYPKPA